MELDGFRNYEWHSQVMRVMGFTYVPGTAGSSVRFDPPHPKDPVCKPFYCPFHFVQTYNIYVLVNNIPQT